MSASKPAINDTRKRRSYKQPALAKLTPEAAKKVLEAKSIPGDRQADNLFREIRCRVEDEWSDPSANGRVRESGVTEGINDTKASIVRYAIFAAVLLLLIATPAFLFIAALSNDSRMYSTLRRITVFWFPLWGIFAVWISLNASALYGFVGPRPSPFGPKALRLAALGFANIAAMFLFLILTKGG